MFLRGQNNTTFCIEQAIWDGGSSVYTHTEMYWRDDRNLGDGEFGGREREAVDVSRGVTKQRIEIELLSWVDSFDKVTSTARHTPYQSPAILQTKDTRRTRIRAIAERERDLLCV